MKKFLIKRYATFLNVHQEEIIDWINTNIKTQFTPTGNIFDRLANQVNQEYPYGEGIDNAHPFLMNAIRVLLNWIEYSQLEHRL